MCVRLTFTVFWVSARCCPPRYVVDPFCLLVLSKCIGKLESIACVGTVQYLKDSIMEHGGGAGSSTGVGWAPQQREGRPDTECAALRVAKYWL